MSAYKQKRRLPSLNALRAFEVAARHMSFKAAADELNVSQSAVSHQIKALEDMLGISLFARKTRAVELTRKGKLYYPILRYTDDTLAIHQGPRELARYDANGQVISNELLVAA